MSRRKNRKNQRALIVAANVTPSRPWVEVMGALIMAMIAFTQHPETSKSAAALMLRVMKWIRRCMAEETGDWVPRELDI